MRPWTFGGIRAHGLTLLGQKLFAEKNPTVCPILIREQLVWLTSPTLSRSAFPSSSNFVKKVLAEVSEDGRKEKVIDP